MSFLTRSVRCSTVFIFQCMRMHCYESVLWFTVPCFANVVTFNKSTLLHCCLNAIMWHFLTHRLSGMNAVNMVCACYACTLRKKLEDVCIEGSLSKWFVLCDSTHLHLSTMAHLIFCIDWNCSTSLNIMSKEKAFFAQTAQMNLPECLCCPWIIRFPLNGHIFKIFFWEIKVVLPWVGTFTKGNNHYNCPHFSTA